MSASETEERRRLRWQCRRGLLELDLLFTGFLENQYSALRPDEQGTFRRLLEQPDQMLLAWLQGQHKPPVELQKIIDKVVQ